MFVIDASGLIQDAGPYNWNIMLEFIVEVASRVNIGANAVRIGVVKFSNFGTTEIYLDQYFDLPSLSNAVRAITFVGGTTNTAYGLEVAKTDVLIESHGERPDVPNLVLFITDGNANERVDETDDMANALHAVSRVHAIGISSEVSMETLEIIASNKNEITNVDNYNSLLGEIDRIIAVTCASQTPTSAPSPAPTTASSKT